MPKRDSQKRISIPIDLRDHMRFSLNQDIALCYEKGEIFIVNEFDSQKHNVISFRKIDSKGRIFFPDEAVKILGAEKDDIFIVSLRNDKIYINKLQEVK